MTESNRELVLSAKIDLADWAVLHFWWVKGFFTIHIGPFFIYFEVRDVE